MGKEQVDQFNQVVFDYVVREAKHANGCRCERCIPKANQLIGWFNTNTPSSRSHNAHSEQLVIDQMGKEETPEQHDSRMMNMIGEDETYALSLVGQGYIYLVRKMESGIDPGDEAFYGDRTSGR